MRSGSATATAGTGTARSGSLTPSPTPPLTSLAAGAGCGCKLPASALLPLVSDLAVAADERLLVGSATGDDAAVFRLSDDLALVQTIDFFTPLVDDPYDFGRIAAANALSDVYAMGGKPLTALNVVAFPLAQLGASVLSEILRGGLAVAEQAGVAIVGGHSIDDAEPKYGLAVTGTVEPDALLTNAGAHAGDALVLTKPLGTGATIAARRHGLASDEQLATAVATMVALNEAAASAAMEAGAHAATDVTGFGLLGHLHNICRESGLAAEVDAAAVPTLPGVEPLLSGDVGRSGGSRRNAGWAERFTRFDPAVAEWRRWLLADATTSGGLLVALPEAAADELPGARIGRLVEGSAGTIRVR